MQIAFLTWCLPYPPDAGAKIRTYHILKNLGQRHNIDLFVMTKSERPDYGDLGKYCTKIKTYPIEKPLFIREKIARLTGGVPFSVSHFFREKNLRKLAVDLNKKQYDLIFIDELVIFPYTCLDYGTPKLLHMHKADHLFFYDMSKRLGWGIEKIKMRLESMLLKKFVKKALRQCKNALVCSTEEANLFREMVPRISVRAAGNGVDLDHFRFQPPRESNPPVFMFQGTMNYYPNVDATLYFFREIYPVLKKKLSDFRVILAGQNPSPEVLAFSEKKDVTVTGYVEDMAGMIEQATVIMAPLRIGHGTRLKIPEAFAAGRPVVTTSIGCEGIDGEHESHMLVADSPGEFAESLFRMATDEKLRKRLCKNARKLVEEKYSWKAICKDITSFCEEISAKEGIRFN